MFKGKRGQQLARDIGKRTRTFVPGAGLPEKKGAAAAAAGPTPAAMEAKKHDMEAIKVGIITDQFLPIFGFLGFLVVAW